MDWQGFKIWNRDVNVRKLREHVKGNRVVVVAGIGASFQLATPVDGLTKNNGFDEVKVNLSWDGLIKRGYEDLKLKEKYVNRPKNGHKDREKEWNDNRDTLKTDSNLTVTDYLSFADLLEKCGKEYHTWINNIFGHEALNTIANYGLAAGLDSLNAPIITTNYDDLLRNSLHRKHNKQNNLNGFDREFFNKINSELKNPPINNAERMLHHLHGHYSNPEALIFGRSSYKRIRDQQVAGENMFTSGTNLLFVGIGEGGIDDHWIRIFTEQSVIGYYPTIYWIIQDDENSTLEKNIKDKLKNICQFDNKNVLFIKYREHHHLPLLLLSLSNFSVDKSSRRSTSLPPHPGENYFPLDDCKKIFSNHVNSKDSVLLAIDGPGGSGKTTLIKSMYDLHKDRSLYYSFNSHGYSASYAKHNVPEQTSRQFFIEAITRIGFTAGAALIWAQLLFNNKNDYDRLDKDARNALKGAYKSVKNSWISVDQTWKYDYKNVQSIINAVFSKEHGNRAELLHFLMIQGPFVLFLDGIEPLQVGYHSKDADVPISEIKDKELLVFLLKTTESYQDNHYTNDIQAKDHLVVLSSRYLPKFIVNNHTNNKNIPKPIEVWGIPLNNESKENEHIKIAISNKLFIEKNGTTYVSPLLINILRSITRLLHISGTKRKPLLSNKSLSTSLYDQLHSHVYLAIEALFKIDGIDDILKMQHLVKMLSYFDYSVNDIELKQFKVIDTDELKKLKQQNRENVNGLIAIYGAENSDSNSYELHPLVRQYVRNLLQTHDHQSYLNTHKKIADNILIEYDPDIDINDNSNAISPVKNPLDLLCAFRKAQHYIEAEEYEKACSTFTRNIQGKNYIAGNKFGMHPEILSLLNRFYPESWSGGIYRNDIAIRDDWAGDINKAAAHSLMSTGESGIALSLENRTEQFLNTKITESSDEINKSEYIAGYIDCLMRQVDMAIYAGEYENAVDIAKNAIHILKTSDVKTILLEHYKDGKHYLYWLEVAYGRAAYAYNWKALKQNTENIVNTTTAKSCMYYFKQAEKHANDYRDFLDNSKKPIGFEMPNYHSMPHIIWKERFHAFKLRRSKQLDILEGIKNDILTRLQQFENSSTDRHNKGRIGYISLNNSNLAICEFRISFIHTDENRSKILNSFDNKINRATTMATVSGKTDFQLYALSSALWHLSDLCCKKAFMENKSDANHAFLDRTFTLTKSYISRYEKILSEISNSGPDESSNAKYKGCYEELLKGYLKPTLENFWRNSGNQ